MDNSYDRYPEDTEKRKRRDWIQIGILIVLGLAAFPFIVLFSLPLLWILLRFLIPLALVGFVVYFGIKFLQLGNLPENTGQNFTKVWGTFIEFVRRTFLKVALTFVSGSLVVIAIILAYKHYSKDGLTQEKLQKISQSAEKYKSHHGFYPSSLADLVGNDPLKREWFLDSWKNNISYRTTAAGFSVSSVGRDGQAGTSDDLTVTK